MMENDAKCFYFGTVGTCLMVSLVNILGQQTKDHLLFKKDFLIFVFIMLDFTSRITFPYKDSSMGFNSKRNTWKTLH